MKKYFLYLVAIAAAIVATSCSRVESPSGMGEESTLTFVVSTPEISTRAVADGTNATDLYYGVYAMRKNDKDEEVWTLQGDISKTTTPVGINLTTQVNLTLVNGKEYSLLFWAENPASKAEVNWETLDMGYAPEYSNHDVYDAFYAYVPTFKVTGSINQDVTLKRPFAQLNIGANDMAAAKAAGMEVAKTKVTVEGVYSGMSLVTGAVTGQEQTVTYQMYDISPIKGEVFPVVNNTYMAMNYLLVNAEKALSVITLEYEGTDGVTYTRTYNSVPVQRNWRTNIYGSILTDEAKYNVTIEPEMEGAYNREFPEVSTEQQLIDVVKNGGTALLQNDIEISKTLQVDANASVVIDLNGYDLIVNNTSVELEEGDAIIVYGNLSIKGEGTVKANTRAVWARGEGAVINIYGGNYIGCSTSDANSEVIYASKKDALINIYGGTFEAVYQSTGFTPAQKAVLNLKDKSGADIVVYGGTFKDFDPSNNVSENPAYDFVADGYISVANSDGSYTVKPFSQENLPAGALTNDVTLVSDASFTSSVVVGAGVEFDGAGHTVSMVKSATQYAIVPQGGVIKNVAIKGYNTRNEGGKVIRAIMIENATEDVVIDNVVAEGVAYPLNTGGGIGTDLTLTVNNSRLVGWTSFATFKSASFTNCQFAEGTYFKSENQLAAWDCTVKPYIPTTFEGCTFDKGFYVDFSNLAADAEVTFKQCRVGGVVVTAENFESLLNNSNYSDVASRVKFE